MTASRSSLGTFLTSSLTEGISERSWMPMKVSEQLSSKTSAELIALSPSKDGWQRPAFGMRTHAGVLISNASPLSLYIIHPMFSVPGIALITGAGSGIGRATALAFARAGASGLHLVDINRARLEQASKDVSTVATNPEFKSHISETDVTKEDRVVQMVQDTLKTFGRIDYAANIAGITESVLGPTADTSLETYDRVNNLNARGVFLCMREELKAMRAQEPLARIPGRPGVRGSITNMSSIAGCIGLNGVTSYVASKHAVVGMTKAAAISHSVDGIRVNAVCPGYVDTPLLRDLGDLVDVSVLEKMTPMNRLALTEEVADVVVFMASERASYVTGHSFVVDGGFSVA